MHAFRLRLRRLFYELTVRYDNFMKEQEDVRRLELEEELKEEEENKEEEERKEEEEKEEKEEEGKSTSLY